MEFFEQKSIRLTRINLFLFKKSIIKSLSKEKIKNTRKTKNILFPKKHFIIKFHWESNAAKEALRCIVGWGYSIRGSL
jgi:hypothetical protein